MKITARTLFLAIAVFLNFIELVISVEPVATTLAQLFPDYRQNGYLPTIYLVVNRAATNSMESRRIGNHSLRRTRHAPFLARGRVIFAWQGDHRNYVNDRMGDYAEPLWQLFQPIVPARRWVFDTHQNRWVTLNVFEFEKLGFGYRMTLVLMQSDYAARHSLLTTNARAHLHAYLTANHQVDLLQANEARKIDGGETTIDDSIEFIRRSYKDAYDIAFHDFTDQYG